jgi:hypothetical protein
MSVIDTANEFLGDVRNFNKAMDGPSGDAENETACKMRDSAIAVLREFGAQDSQVSRLLQGFDSEED